MAIFLAINLLSSYSSLEYTILSYALQTYPNILAIQYFFEEISMTVQVKFLYQLKFVFAHLGWLVFYFF